jgi:peptide deformylase
MIIKLKTGEILQGEDKYIDLNQKLVMFYIYYRENDKVIKKKVFINPEIIEYIEFESEETKE